MLVVISPEKDLANELETVLAMLEAGLTHYHLRKPYWTAEQSESFILALPQRFRERVRLHQNHELCQYFPEVKRHYRSQADISEAKGASVSCHSLTEIEEKIGLDYYFLSPIFDSISKVGYQSGFNQEHLQQGLPKLAHSGKRVVALGGIDSSNVGLCKEWGFTGVAVLGSIWKHQKVEDRIKEFQTIWQESLTY